VQHHYRPLKKNPALTLGIAIHTALEKYYGSGEDLVEAFHKAMDTGEDWVVQAAHALAGVELAENKKLRDLGTAMLINYFEEYQDEKLEVLATEMEIARRVPIPADDASPPPEAQDFYVAARVDLIVHDQLLDQTFAMDHKTYERFYMGQLEMSTQLIIEKYVAEGWLGKPVVGTIYNGLWKRKTPTKSQSQLFQRHPVYVNPHQVTTTLYRVYWQLRRMHSPDFRVYPETGTMKCQYCPFKQPCAEYIRGGDWQFVLDNLFVRKDYEHDLVFGDDRD